jgi:hypothetical protein
MNDINTLCELLRDAYLNRTQCLEAGKIGTANTLFKRAVGLLRQLRSQSGSEFATVLSRMLEASEPELCVLLAAEGLWEIPLEAEKILLKIREGNGFVSLSAYYTLDEWRKGRYSRPTEWEWKNRKDQG